MNGILLNDKRFTDFEAYAENMMNWNLELNQLSKGKFEGNIQQAILPNVIIQKYIANKSLRIRGTAPQGYQNYSILLNGKTAALWRGKELTSQSVAMFPENGELEAISPEGFTTFELAVSNEYLKKVGNVIGIHNISNLIQPDKVFKCDPNRLNMLKRTLIKSSFGIKKHCRQHTGRYIDELEFDVTFKLLEIFNKSTNDESFIQTDKRRYAIKKVEEITEGSRLEDLTVPDLCREAEVSLRTLEYAFQEKYHMTPNQYLRTVKLNNVKKILSHLIPSEINITDIANRNGFWHMGQFAKDYRNLFGELPSETLKKYRLFQ